MDSKCDDSIGWMENIPYIWWDELDKMKCVRKYLIYIKSKSKPKDEMLSKTDDGNTVLTAVLELSKTDPNISPYSYLVYSTSDMMNKDDLDRSNPLRWDAVNKGELRVNGRKVPIPEKVSNSKTISVQDLYFYLNLSGINPSKISSLLKESYTAKSYRKSEFPQDYAESSYILKKDPGMMKFCFLFWFIENISQYSGVCMPIDNTINKTGISGYSMDINVNDINFDNVDLPENLGEFKRMVESCMENRDVNRIVFSVGINYKFTNVYNGHSNVVVINKKITADNKLNVYVFDPWGQNIAHDKNKIVLTRLLNQLIIQKSTKTKYKFIQKHCVSSDVSNFDENLSEHIKKLSTKLTGNKINFCQVWALWMLELFLKKSIVEYDEIVKYYQEDLRKDKKEFTEFIDRYSEFISTTCNKKLKDVDGEYNSDSGKITKSPDFIKLNTEIIKAKNKRVSMKLPTNIRRMNERSIMYN
jgi:hypothetical protein